MTRIYNDIAAVTLLLQEKERDLELAARIGQNLLYENQALRTRNDELDDLLHDSNEKVAQLKHVICVKDALIRVYYDNNTDESPPESPKNERLKNSSSHNRAVDVLRCKIRELEEENTNLRIEHAQLTNEATDIEVREAELVNDCVRRLADDRREIEALHEELRTSQGENSELSEQVNDLRSKLCETNRLLTKIMDDNMELKQQVESMAKEQNELSKQVSSWEDRYEECFALLSEARDNIHELERQKRPGVLKYHSTHMSPYLSSDTLALELEESLHQDLDYPDGYTPSERKLHNLQVMSTVRAARSSCVGRDLLASSPKASRSHATTTSDISSSLIGSGGLDTMSNVDTYDSADLESLADSRSALVPSPCPSALYRRMPEPLQIIKPLTGSYSLHRWQRLATPNLSAVLTSRPGVQIRGEEPSHRFTEQIFSLSDPEEDDDNSSTLEEELQLVRRSDSLDDILIAATCHSAAITTSLTARGASIQPIYSQAGCVPPVCSSDHSSLDQERSTDLFAARFFKRLLRNASNILGGSRDADDNTDGGKTSDNGENGELVGSLGGFFHTRHEGDGDASVACSKGQFDSATGSSVCRVEDNWGRERVDPTGIGLNSITAIKRSVRSRRFSANKRGMVGTLRSSAVQGRALSGYKPSEKGMSLGNRDLHSMSSKANNIVNSLGADKTRTESEHKSKTDRSDTGDVLNAQSQYLPDIVAGLTSNTDNTIRDVTGVKKRSDLNPHLCSDKSKPSGHVENRENERLTSQSASHNSTDQSTEHADFQTEVQMCSGSVSRRLNDVSNKDNSSLASSSSPAENSSVNPDLKSTAGKQLHGLTVVLPCPTARRPGQPSPARPNSLNVTPVYSPPVALTIGSAVDPPVEVKVDVQL